MKLMVGLGNPGGKYEGNRHNVGYMAVDRIAEDHGFAPWRAKFQGLVSEGRLGREKVLLLKPTTFMNLSGQSVGEAMRFYKLGPDEVIVLHDELDLAPGKCRVKTGGGHAGHNGLRSIHQHVSDAYTRVRIGVGHPGRKELVSAWVLQDFTKADQAWLDDLLRGISDGAPDLAEGDGGRFMNAVARRLAPARPSTGGKPDKADTGAHEPRGEKRLSKDPRPAKAPEPEPDTRSALQRLVDKFS
ncbi:aminoacyl-tRNA hydrolase [Oceanomicrobium pacificus]|uniref:Peptidyl-tRNA hydrolase n=1 Tax=Oceanomicrobium pacificus TaxID=2692916 RepID=A0A6B0TKP4_9RHOB|nr:aminoacyl-tRNA hydrolase [Oceanomicrobium pacificus]MXU64426.1 aminoacyl-tRNA hydrolase [Oceanomicrobium pacificus]